MRETTSLAARRWWRALAAPLCLAAALVQAAPVDTDSDGIPDEIEPYEGTSPLVKDNEIFQNASLFVKQQYRDFLGREVDPAGYAYWSGVIAAGSVPRDWFAHMLLTSDEVNARFSPIVRLYLAYFRRAPDLEGLLGWERYFSGGMTLEQISDGFVLSPEFQATYGAKTNAEFLQLVYRNVLNRQPDPYGYTWWLAELDSGRRSRGMVMVGFSESAEFQAATRNEFLVTMAYAALFRRTPDAGGFAGWVAALDAGGSPQAMVAGFMNTVEYKDRFVHYFSLPATSAAVDAARFLTQATFGPRSLTEIARVQAIGYDRWLNEQFAAPPVSQLQYMYDETLRRANGPVYDDQAYEAIWNQWLWGTDQLRGRMAFALSEILVVSNIAPNLNAYSMAAYMDILNRNAFGNFRTLLRDVTLAPAMGEFLNMRGNDKEDPARGRLPNENYAREVLQLFSIGLVQLNPDGTPVTGSDGKPVPTYDEEVVKGFAKVFTGWNYAGNDTTSNSAWNNPKKDHVSPMVAWPARHSTSEKRLLNGVVLPPNQSAQKDLDDALDNIFWHPNVGPFICRQLIQRLVTSNPSPAQISRCSAKFANNGLGERGNLANVVHTILLDPEARNPAVIASTTFGKQREPVIRFANLLRAFNARSSSGRNGIHYLDSPDDGLAQSPLVAPSVFNFFSPNYRAPGVIAQSGLVSPEFQITTETSVVGALNFLGSAVDRAAYGWGDTQLNLDYGALQSIAFDPGRLADHINMLLMAGAMSAQTRDVIVRAVGAISASKSRDRVEAALQLAMFSPDFTIQK
jgi:uncharacterized protein (DUF1800 family)